MATDALGRLFGSTARLKLLRLFLFNPTIAFDADQAATRLRLSPREAAREMVLLLRARVLKRKSVIREEYVKNKRGKGMVVKRKRVKGVRLDESFPYIAALQQLLLHDGVGERELLKRLRKTGRLKLLVVAGAFLGEWDKNLDVLIVGEKLKNRRIEGVLHSLEADLGRELQYVVLTPGDFSYRHNVNDKLIRDVFDYPHRVVYDRMGIH